MDARSARQMVNSRPRTSGRSELAWDRARSQLVVARSRRRPRLTNPPIERSRSPSGPAAPEAVEGQQADNSGAPHRGPAAAAPARATAAAAARPAAAGAAPAAA